MRITRLSRVPPLPIPMSETIKSDISVDESTGHSLSPAPRTNTILSIINILLFSLLSFAIVLTLLPLLLPTSNHYNYSFFSIEPTPDGTQRQGESGILSSSNSTTDDNISVADIVLPNSGSGGTSKTSWLGEMGPSIYVGALQICSRAKIDAESNCTSSSQTAYHASLLPSSLSPALLSLPTAPISPILLLVSGIPLLIACFVLLCGWIPFNPVPHFKLKISRRSNRRRRLSITPHRSVSQLIVIPTTDSTTICAQKPEQQHEQEKDRGRIRKVPHIAFFTLILVALALSASALVQLRDVLRSRSKWDQGTQDQFGMVFKFGVFTYLLPVLPVTHLIILLVAAIPKVIFRSTSKVSRPLVQVRQVGYLSNQSRTGEEEEIEPGFMVSFPHRPARPLIKEQDDQVEHHQSSAGEGMGEEEGKGIEKGKSSEFAIIASVGSEGGAGSRNTFGVVNGGQTIIAQVRSIDSVDEAQRFTMGESC